MANSGATKLVRESAISSWACARPIHDAGTTALTVAPNTTI